MKNVAIIFGGLSAEHDISILTGVKTSKLFRRNFNVFPVYWGLDNKFYHLKNINFNDYTNKEKLMRFGKRIEFVRGGIYLNSKDKLKFYANIDNVINCCHGGAGENGELVSYLKINEINCNSGVLSSVLCNNKFILKQMLNSLNINTPKCVLINSADIDEKLKYVYDNFNGSIIVKPNTLGSSIGIVKTNVENVKEIAELILHLDDQIIVEEYIEDADELRTAVLVHNNTLCYAQIEKIKIRNDIYSFEDKYLNKRCLKEFPAKIDNEVKDAIYKIIKKLHNVFNFVGVVEFQFLYSLKEKELYLNEINTIPKNLGIELFEGIGVNSKIIGECFTESNKKIKKQTYFNTDILYKIDL